MKSTYLKNFCCLKTLLNTIIFFSCFVASSNHLVSEKASLSQSNNITATLTNEPHVLVSQDTRQRLEEIEQRRHELHERATLMRKKEQLALIKLSHIESKLNIT